MPGIISNTSVLGLVLNSIVVGLWFWLRSGPKHWGTHRVTVVVVHATMAGLVLRDVLVRFPPEVVLNRYPRGASFYWGFVVLFVSAATPALALFLCAAIGAICLWHRYRQASK